MSNRYTTRPSIPSEMSVTGWDSLRRFLGPVKALLEIHEGWAGRRDIDRFVRKGELGGLAGSDIGDLTIPDFWPSDAEGPNPPTNFTVVAALWGNRLSWINPTDDDLASIEVWVNTSNDKSGAHLAAIVTIPTELRGQASTYTHYPANPTLDHYYWIRAIDYSHNYSTWVPTDAMGGELVKGIDTIGQTIDKIMALLQAPNAPAYSGSTTYYAGQIVAYGGYLYRVYFDNNGAGVTGIAPDDPDGPDYWMMTGLVIQGVVDGQPTVGINGALVVDETVLARSIKTDELIAGGNVTIADNSIYVGHITDSAINDIQAAPFAAAAAAQSTADGKIMSWFQEDDPNTWAESDRPQHNGDMWYKASTRELKRYQADTNDWILIEDQKAIDAFTKAETAQDTADGKRRVFTAEPTTPYDVGDLWSEGSTGDIKRCKVARSSGAYNAGDWELASKYDKTSQHPFVAYRIYEFRNSADNFSAVNADITLNSDSIVITPTTDDPQFKRAVSIDGSLYDRVRVRIKRNSGSTWQGHLFYSTSGHGFTGSYMKHVGFPDISNGEYTVLEWDMSDLTSGGDDWITNTITNIRFDFATSTDTVYEVDWVAIGKKSIGDITQDALNLGAVIDHAKANGFTLIRNGYIHTDLLDVDNIIATGSILVTGDADITAENTAAAIAGQGALATKDDIAEGDLQSPVLNRMFLDAQTKANIEAWRKAGSPTYLDGGKIYSQSIIGDKIVAGTLTADKMNVVSLSAIAADLGTITAGLAKSYDNKLQVDLDNKSIKVWDAQTTPQLRVKLGLVDSENGIYGIQTYDASGNLVVSYDGLGLHVVNNAQITDLAVSTLKIQDHAVTIPVSAYISAETDYNGSDGEVCTLISASITSTGAPIQINITCLINFWDAAHDDDVRVYIYRGGTKIYDLRIYADPNYIKPFSAGYTLWTANISDTPGNGTTTYYVKIGNLTPDSRIKYKNRGMLLLETKK